MATNEVNRPDLLLHLQFVLHEVQTRLQGLNLYEVARDTGISYSNLCRLRSGGVPSLPTLELLAYHFGPKPEPKPIDESKLTRCSPPPNCEPAPWE